ncbi:MAG TPA: hypothetical protein VE988_28380, partial [Gemmataceae bacterium]|nr:hypothetical protein [Gemmataceae bacterium]
TRFEIAIERQDGARHGAIPQRAGREETARHGNKKGMAASTVDQLLVVSCQLLLVISHWSDVNCQDHSFLRLTIGIF